MFRPPTPAFRMLAAALLLTGCALDAHADDRHDPAARRAAVESIARAWSQLHPGSADAPNVSPPVRWRALTAFVAVSPGPSRAPAVLQVDPRRADELERLLVATAISDRLRLRESLRRYALDRAAASVATVPEAPTTFWDEIGWTGPGRALLADQPAFRALVDAMRDQSYRWLVARALAVSAAPAASSDRAEDTARRLLGVGEWPLFPLGAAVLVVAADDPRGVAGRESWLCGAAAINYAGARLLRHDSGTRATLARDRLMRARLAEWLAELELLNEQYACGLSW